MFKAHPAPSFKKGFEVEPSDKPLTETEPFELRSEKRHEASVTKMQEQLDVMIATANQAQNFRARPLTDKVVYGAPIEVVRNTVPLTKPEEVHLRSQARAAERGIFNETVAKARQLEEEAKAQQRQEKQQQETLEMKQLRRMSFEDGGFNFIAKEIMEEDPHPLPTGHVPISLTDPKSPFLLTKQRASLASRG
jgi:targeting protein for Xklp2